MRLKNILGFAAVTIFAAKGGYRLYQYYTNKKDYVESLADVTKDAMDGVNDIVDIFSNDQHEKDMCSVATEFGKGAVDAVVAAEKQQNYGRNL